MLRLWSVAALLTSGPSLFAGTVQYQYFGNTFTQFDFQGLSPFQASIFAPNDSLDGQFLLDSLLPPNLSVLVNPIALSFSGGNGPLAYVLGNEPQAPSVDVTTDSTGNVLYWNILLPITGNGVFPNGLFLQTEHTPTGISLDQIVTADGIVRASATNKSGTWNVILLASVPEPSSLVLCCAGFSCFVILGRRRLNG